MKKFLTATVCAVFALGCACAFAGCGTDYSDEIKDLQKQIQELENKNNSLQTELNALKNGSGSSTDYTAEINSLKQQIKALETKCNSANSSITKLQQDLNAAKLRLDAVEGAMQADKNYTYQMGEVCTVKSASGIELYKVRLLDYNNSNQLTFNIQNINLPDYINLNDYFTVCTYSEANTKKYSYKRNTFYYSEENNFEYISYINFSLNSPARDEVTYFIIGLPSEDFSNGGAEEHIIPYAIYNFN